MSSTARITLKQNDLLPIIVATVTDDTGAIVDLTNVASVAFYMRNQVTGTIKVNGSAGAIVSPTAGTVSYTWASGDTDTIGDYLAEFVLTWLTGNKQQSAPQKTNLYISIIDGVK